MHVVKDAEVVIRSGDGVWLEPTDGRRYLDATAALWYCNVGYGRARDRRRGRRAARDGCRRTRRSGPTRPSRRSRSPIAWRRWRRSTTPSSSSARAARTRSTRRPSSPAATGTSSGKPEKRVIVVARARLPRHARAGARRSPASRPTRPATAATFIDEVVTRRRRSTSRRLGALFEQRGDEIAAFIGEPVIGAGGVYPARAVVLGARSSGCAASTTSCSSPTRSSRASGGPASLWGVAALRHRAGHDHVRQGRDVRLHAARRRARRARASRRRSGTSPAPGRCSATATRTRGHAAALRRGAWPTSTSSSGEGLVARVADAGARARRGGPPAGGAAARRRGPDRRADRGRRDRAGPCWRPIPGIPARVVAAALRHGVATRVLRGHALHISPAVRDHRGARSTRWSTASAPRSRTSPRPERRAARPGPRPADLIPAPGGATIVDPRRRPPRDPVDHEDSECSTGTQRSVIRAASRAAGRPATVVEGGPARGRTHLPDGQRSSNGSSTSSRDGCSSRSSARTST